MQWLIVFFSELNQEIWRAHESQIERFFGTQDHLSVYWFLGALAVAIVYAIFNSKSYARILTYLKVYFSSRRVRQEFVIDVQFFASRWFTFPFVAMIFGVGFFTLNRQVANLVTPYFLEVSPLPRMTLSSGWSLAGFAFFIFMVADFSAYFAHFCHHRVPFLWELHKIHHRCRYLNPLTRYRTHIGEEVTTLVLEGTMSGLLLGIAKAFVIPPSNQLEYAALFAFLTSNFLTQHLQHSHVWVSFGTLNKVFISPAHHQLHHSRLPKHFNKNYGFVFTLWDTVFGTVYQPQRRERFPMGLEEVYEPQNQTWWSETLRPFRRPSKSVP